MIRTPSNLVLFIVRQTVNMSASLHILAFIRLHMQAVRGAAASMMLVCVWGTSGLRAAAISAGASYFATDLIIALRHFYIDRFCPDDDGYAEPHMPALLCLKRCASFGGHGTHVLVRGRFPRGRLRVPGTNIMSTSPRQASTRIWARLPGMRCRRSAHRDAHRVGRTVIPAPLASH